MRVSVVLYLLSLLLMGVGYIAIMPPFEGFDEAAHYASLRQIADTGTIPLYGKSYLPEDVAGYRGPIAYSPLKLNQFGTGKSYPEFFSDRALVSRFEQDYGRPHPPPSFVPSVKRNWEAQHPPLYYLIMARLLRPLESASFLTQILVLRLVSYLLALVGVFFGLLAAYSVNATTKFRVAYVGYLLYPVALPMFFPEFARIGNDSLCLLFTGTAAFFLAEGLANESGVGWPVGIGASLGLGLLTKALFLPITFAIGVYLLLRLLGTRSNQYSRRLQWRNGAITLILPLLIGSGWYLHDYLAYGEFTGSDEVIQLAHHGGILPNLIQNFSLVAIWGGVTHMIKSWVWLGTWSMALMSPPLYAPLFLLLAMMIAGFAIAVKRTPITRPEWLPIILFAAFAAGLFYHVLTTVAIGAGGTPGWYLHILLPWEAPALGVGVAIVVKRPWRRLLFIALVSYAVLFQVAAIWAQIALFTGCAIKGGENHYSFSGHLFCLDQASTLYERLAIVSWPNLACLGFGGGLLCAAWLAIRMQLKVAPQ
jgi:hypothetical protein